MNGQFTECHPAVGPMGIGFLFELGLDEFRLLAVLSWSIAGAGDTIDVEVCPPDIAVSE
jgi:hypothetical protein